VALADARDAGRNVRPLGEDMRVGDRVLAAGTPITAGVVGVLAACGASVVSVFRRPRVAIAGSGDELVELDRFAEALAGRKVVSTNGYALHAAVRAAGGTPVDLGVAADSPAALRERFERAAGCDLLVTSAGNSAGAFDYTQDAVRALGGRVEFRRVRMRPGAPLSFGVVAGVPWIGLPGNPVSALVTAELFVRPAIRRLGGHPAPFRAPVEVTLAEEVRTGAPGLTHYLRVVVSADADGRLSARLTGPQGSGLVSSMARANALLVVPEGRPSAAPGERLLALLLDDAPAAGVAA
jgi:molybdopterin molybdotransferase